MRERHSRVPARTDDFLIVGANPEPTMKEFEENFLTRALEINPAARLGLKWEVSKKGK